MANLAANLITNGFEKFCQTEKVFLSVDVALVTRKGVNPYEYTGKWSRMVEPVLPVKKRGF